MNQLEWNLRNDICEAAKHLYTAGFLSGSDINQAAIRVDDAETAASVNKLHQSHSKMAAVEAGIYSGYCHADECQSESLKACDRSPNEDEIKQIVQRVVQHA